MSKPKQPKHNKMTTTAWTGLWTDGQLGWRFSPYLYPGGHAPARSVIDGDHFPFQSNADDRFFKVRVTVEVLRDTRGRPISRRGGVRVGAVQP